jgi:hypothetical protein
MGVVAQYGGSVTDKRPGDQDARYERILLATEGRVIPPAAIDRLLELAAPGAEVRVLSIARVHGTAFGMPSPGLLPTKKEWAAQRDLVAKAVGRLKRKGVTAKGHVLGTRNATKKILTEAAMHSCEAIVMAADPDRNRLVAVAMWSQEPQRIRRKAKLPVYLVAVDD